MKLYNIKAPKSLKSKTIFLMKKELNHKTKRKSLKVAAITACISVLFVLTAFAYSIFSGLAGDELSFSTEYKGNGIVEVTVQNQSEKKLQFTDTVKLERWSTSQEILTVKHEMPLIKPGETKIFTIDLSKYDIELLETPLIGTDWYYFVFTNNNFIHGHDWMASVTFAKPSNVKPEIILPSEKPLEDNTSKEDVITIKNNYKIQKPLNNYSISSPYNDYKENGKYVHAELDLKAESGKDIFSISEGTVVEADFDSKMGLYIIIDHGNGLVSKYAHCKELFKEKGDIIGLDDVIASVGKTGMAVGNHLALSVTFNGAPINPELLFE